MNTTDQKNEDSHIANYTKSIDFNKLDPYNKSIVNELLLELQSTKSQLKETNQIYHIKSKEYQLANEQLLEANEKLEIANKQLVSSYLKLEQSKIEMDNMFKSTHIGILLLDSNLCIRKFTEGITKYYYITNSDLSEPISNFATTFTASYKDQIIKYAKEIIEGKNSIEFEFCQDKHQCILVNITPYYLDPSHKDGVVINFMDITQRKHLEEALQLEQEKLISGYNIAKFSISEWDIPHDRLIPNENWYSLLGQQSSPLVYSISSFIEIIHADNREKVKEGIQAYLSGKSNTFYGKFKIYNNMKAAYCWIEATFKIITYDENKQPLKAIFIIHEITALVEQEAELYIKDMALKNSMIQTVSFNANGELQYANNIAVETINFADVALYPIKYTSIVSSEDLINMSWKDYYQQLKEKKHRQFEAIQIDNKNNKVPVIVSENFIKYGDKESIFVFILNITETVESKQNFEQTLDIYKMAEDIAGIGYLDIDLNEGTTKLSDGLYRLIGTKEVTHYNDFFNYTTKEEVKNIKDTFFSALKSHTPFDTKFTVNFNNNILHIRAKGRFTYDKNNHPIRAIILAMDITETVLNEMRILENKSKFKSLFENMSSPCTINRLIYNEEGEAIDFMVIDCNTTFLDTFNLRNEEVMHCKASHSSIYSLKTFLSTCKSVVATGKESTLEINYEDIGKYYIIHIYKHSPDTFVTIFSDISVTKILEKESIHSEKMIAIGQLAGGIAHDFNNQLMGMQGSIELIKHSDSPEINEKYIGMISNSIKSCTGLINQLLTFSKKKDYIDSEIDVHEAISKTIDILSHTFDKKISIISTLDAKHCKVTGDSSLLENAFMNIMINARDAMPSGGQITITTALIERKIYTPEPVWYIQIDISDTGHGIDPETQKRIFDPFFTTKGLEGGNGMGLSTVYGTVEKMNGFIDVHSVIDQGTTFSIILPVLIKTNLAFTENAPEPLSLSLPYSVLLVDDEPIIRDVFSTLLRQRGLTVTDFESGSEAIAFYATNYDKIDLVFLDMIMPEMNGIEVFEQLNKINPCVKALLISGFSDGIAIDTAVKCGLIGKISKPIEIDYIIKEIIRIQHLKTK
jgi:nitrogen-specific signal transduction histidine kinase/CheY-like chemotaxis protein